jgi:hypothetical protein
MKVQILNQKSKPKFRSFAIAISTVRAATEKSKKLGQNN